VGSYISCTQRAQAMSIRYHRHGTYQTQNPIAATNPLRSIPLIQRASAVFGTSWHDGAWKQPKPAVG